MVVRCTEISANLPTILTRFAAGTITDFQHLYVQQGWSNRRSDVLGDFRVFYSLISA